METLIIIVIMTAAVVMAYCWGRRNAPDSGLGRFYPKGNLAPRLNEPDQYICGWIHVHGEGEPRFLAFTERDLAETRYRGQRNMTEARGPLNRANIRA